MPMIPVINPVEVRPRLRRAGKKRLKFRPRSPLKGYRVNRRRRRRSSLRRNVFGRTLMVVNPRHRRRRRRMPAALKAYWASRRGATNPPRRRRRSFSRRARRNPAVPRRLGQVLQAGLITDALWGAAGFLGTRTVPAMLPVPVQFKVGPMRYVTGAVTAWGLGQLARQFAGSRVGNMIWMGGIIAVASDVMSEVLLPLLPAPTVAPAAPAGTSGYLSRGGANGVGSYLPYGVENQAAW